MGKYWLKIQDLNGKETLWEEKSKILFSGSYMIVVYLLIFLF